MLNITNINKSARAERMQFRWLPFFVAGYRKTYARIEWLNYWFEFYPALWGYAAYFGSLALVATLVLVLAKHLI